MPVPSQPASRPPEHGRKSWAVTSLSRGQSPSQSAAPPLLSVDLPGAGLSNVQPSQGSRWRQGYLLCLGVESVCVYRDL